jgi:hypothetical protein
MKRLDKFRRRSWAEQALLLEAAMLLSLTQLAVHTLPGRWIIRLAGQQQTETPLAPEPQHVAQVRRVRWAVQTAARHVPLPCQCLAQALTAKLLLARRGIMATLYIGVHRQALGSLRAHAWLRCGTIDVTGAPVDPCFRIIATFGGSGT